MTLAQVLDIDGNFLRHGDQEGMIFAELAWQGLGCPTTLRPLIEALEHILRQARAGGIYYPAILLKRKKELERGIFQPKAASKAPVPAIPSDPTCPHCHGQGIVTTSIGTGTLCECYRKRLAGQVQPRIA